MKTTRLNFKNFLIMMPMALIFGHMSFAQTNVFDDVISQSPNHTYLTAAINQQNLAGALQNPDATLTVFAPTDAAFDALADALNTDIAGLLALPNLTDVLLYHVLGMTAPSSAVTNGLLVTPLNDDNTIKLSVTSDGVFANHAEISVFDLTTDNGVVHVLDDVILPNITVVDLAINNDFNILTTAVIQEGLIPVLSNPFGTFTVLAPTDDAFSALLTALDITADDLLALDNLTDILLYHVFGSEIEAADLSNGLLAQPLNEDNTIKVTVTSTGDVFFNHAQVVLADVTATNGVVHALDNVILPNQTVVDAALDNPGFEVLTTAVVHQELLPVLTNPFGTFTVLAPTDDAFGALLTALDITADDLLALDNLTDILLYHVFGSEIEAADLSNGLLAQPLNEDNTIKVTVTSTGDVFFNHAQVVLADVSATNGVVHALDNVILPFETVVDVAINNDFNYLTAALVQEELLPTLTNPFGEFTVFAPTDAAFEDLATELNTDIAGLLALENLTTVLLYHVAPGVLEAADLENGLLTMVSGAQTTINTDGGVTINDASVVLPNVQAFNGIVHVIDQVILPGTSNIENFDNANVTAFPNPTTDFVSFTGVENANIRVIDLNGAEVMHVNYNGGAVDVSNLTSGMYFIYISNEQNQHVVRLSVK